MKRVFGLFEAIFDILYLVTALITGVFLISTATHNPARLLAGITALVLAGGDSFHLIPRIQVIFGKPEETLRTALGRGKQITSITMTIFYLLLWKIGQVILTSANNTLNIIIWGLAVVRILLCFLPQNKWADRYPPTIWGLWRNIPFFLMGAAVAVFFFINRQATPGLDLMWLAICLSFAFYLPVVLWANQNPKIGMLMLPKTCAYLWMLAMLLRL